MMEFLAGAVAGVFVVAIANVFLSFARRLSTRRRDRHTKYCPW